ncbi:phenylalanine 4-monooxygenase [Rudanella paleaurantiibacter]|uniref:phenylalanine 4-monooxygenase n=1 Tax=Rudanella paleaurantiibacter TaxID=2614655 RepID=A0A7J5U2Y1_9BACT|nr:phenylalanine 4-monooxygenase [Rudanella paleaurantiibacter]KAB7731354.1 phenylalanine 4-monooxygenase [Rudanella paleaurantiibacter]
MIQDYSAYTPDDQAVWKLLFERQMERLPGRASQAYMDGIVATGFPNARIPNFEEDLNPRLRPLTGWRVVAVPGLIGNREFFELMADRQFPATTWLRTREQLDYLPEPDMFHDTFGHVPVLTNSHFCDFLAALSRIALAHVDNEEAIQMIAQLYWYTVEFGLIQENSSLGRKGLRIYGGGILSSPGETIYALESDVPQRIPYKVETLLQTPYVIDRFQERYFVIDSYEQLYHSVPEIEAKLEELLAVNS